MDTFRSGAYNDHDFHENPLSSDSHAECIRNIRIKDFIRPEENNQVVLAYVLDRMGIAGWNIDHAEFSAGDRVFDDITAQDMAKPDHSIPFEDDKFLHLGVVVVVAARDARSGARHKDLTDTR